jgi:hypothetical protein
MKTSYRGHVRQTTCAPITDTMLQYWWSLGLEKKSLVKKIWTKNQMTSLTQVEIEDTNQFARITRWVWTSDPFLKMHVIQEKQNNLMKKCSLTWRTDTKMCCGYDKQTIEKSHFPASIMMDLI